MASETRRLYRSKSDHMIGGVCGGLGEYLSMDPTVVRILFILLALTPFNGLIAYLLMLIIVPQEPD